MEYAAQLLEDLSQENIRYEELDMLVWIHSKNQGFQVKSYYRLLRRVGLNFPWRRIRKARIPHQGWLSFHGVWLWERF